jgi:hypothetical protein
MASSNFKRRIHKIQRQTACLNNFKSGPSPALLELLAKLNAMSRERRLEVVALRTKTGD